MDLFSLSPVDTSMIQAGQIICRTIYIDQRAKKKTCQAFFYCNKTCTNY